MVRNTMLVSILVCEQVGSVGCTFRDIGIFGLCFKEITKFYKLKYLLLWILSLLFKCGLTVCEMCSLLP